ncbi:hypothetical protein NLG97_g10941 [Lecanicillium saksenae]|uniref:Uncharacterized protein n=1 Tax=Lecanicillium saksenae TaxID=468837 RepID=A0ACC1QDK1_9HYPO|nr:hypothetical protein NLG97_g10941 [Lecanicillium saksenae]
MSVYRAYFGDSTLSSTARQEILSSSVRTQENDGGSHNSLEVESGLDREIQMMEEAITLQQLKLDTATEMEKLTELKQQVLHEKAVLASIQRSKAERNSSTLAFDDIVAEKYDEFMADEESTQLKSPAYDNSVISLQEQAEELVFASPAAPVQTAAAPMMQGRRGISHFNFRELEVPGKGLLEKAMNSSREASRSSPACIIFKTVIDSDGNLKESNRVQNNADAPSQVKKLAEEYMRQKCSLFDMHGRHLASPSKCLDLIMAAGTNIIVVKQASQLGIKVRDPLMEDSRHKRARLADSSD